jgi:hypothetical protein
MANGKSGRQPIKLWHIQAKVEFAKLMVLWQSVARYMIKSARLFLLLGVSLLLGSPAAAPAANPREDLLLRWHFAGASQLARNPDAAKLKEIWATPSAAEFRQILLQRLPLLPLQLAQVSPENRKVLTPLLQPFVEDLLRCESIFELGRAPKDPDFLLAIDLSDERAEIWSKSLGTLLKTRESEPPKEVTLAGFKGWEVRQKTAAIQLIRAGQWTIIRRVTGSSGADEAWLKQLKAAGRPGEALQNGWFSAEVDSVTFGKIVSAFQLPLKPCRLHVLLDSRDDNVRTSIRAVYPEKLNWKAGDWEIPTRLITEPLRSFAAGQNLGAVLEMPAQLRELGLNLGEEQVYVWSQIHFPFQTFLALRVADSKKAFETASVRLPKTFNPLLQQAQAGELRLGTNGLELAWHGLPLLNPQLRPTREPAGDFLFLALFPPTTSKIPLPEELLQQITGRTNLIYYHWEITQDRLTQWGMLSEFLPFFPNARFIGNKTLTQKQRDSGHQWLEEIAPLLGNTITEVSVAGSNEVLLTRKSHSGLSGFELVWLTNWILDPAFPGITQRQTAADPASPSPTGK